MIYRTTKDGYEIIGTPPNSPRVQIQENDDPPFGSYRLEAAQKAIEHIYKTYKNVAKSYRIVELKGEKMPEAEKTPLSTKTSATDEPNPLLTCQNSECNNQFPRSRGRYPKQYCPECEKLTKR